VTDLYDAHYFEHSCGRPYLRDEYWVGFFARIADRIIEDIAPRTVLDAGCAMGFLVEALRDRGVEAFGIDISEYALAQARDDMSGYVRRAAITDPLDRDYDLIVCIEVLEHLTPDEGEAALDNLCAHASEVLFSSSPTDFREPTHMNVRPTSYWVAQFSKRGMLPDIDYDTSYIAHWARRFRGNAEPTWRVIEAYEHQLSLLLQERESLRTALTKRTRELERITDQTRNPRRESLRGLLASAPGSLYRRLARPFHE
jgi:2-polyprenyl-3-methyl-5-hydroxy-6-metoxy-1,4-benzoquinol methylase